MSHALGEQDGSHHDKFKFVTKAKFTVFTLGDSVANIRFQKYLSRLLKAAVARTLANVQ